MKDFEMAEVWFKIAERWYTSGCFWNVLMDHRQTIKCEMEGLIACHRARMAAGLRARKE